MINTIFHFVNDPTFDYQTAVNNGDISEYTIVFNSADHSIHCKGTMFGRMSRADIAETLGNISDLIPVATDSTLGGIKIGYTNNADLNSRRYGVVLDDNNKAYVEVPWTDTITPVFDDSDIKALIATERNRIDNFITTLSSTIDAKNRELFADAQWVQEVFGVPQAEGSIWQQFENEIDHYLNEYMVWDWVDPNDHTKGRTAKISSIEQDVDGITTRVGTTEERLDNADGEGVTIETFVSTIKQTANDIDAHVGRVETKADANTGAIQSTNVAVSNLELSVNGFYKVDIVNAPNPDTSVNISTISTQLSDRTTALVDDEELNGKLFTTAPTEDVIYKKGSQYFKLIKIKGAVESIAGLTASVSEYDGDLDKLVKMAASTLELKTSKNGNLLTTADLASVITTTPDLTTGSYFTGYSGLNTKVEEAKNGMTANSSLLSHVIVKNDDGQGNVTYDVQSDIISGVINSTSFTDGVATATSTLSSTVADHTASIATKVTKDTNGVIESSVSLKANLIYLDGQTNFKTAVGSFIKTDVLEAGVADIKARLTVGGSDPAGVGTSGSITMKDASDGTIGIWDKDKLAVGTTSSPSSSNSAMLVNADGSGSAAKGNISWNANGDVSVNGVINASSGVFNGVVNATQFKAGSDEGFSITTSPDSLDFNYNGARLAFFSLRGWDSTNNQLADVPDNPTGFYLYLTNPLNGHLVTINFAELSFKDLNENQVLRHGATFYRLSNLNGKAVETSVKLYYSLENNTTKWWLNSDSTTELTSSEMGTLYKKQQQVSQGGVTYIACAQEVDAGIPYVTTGYTLYELLTLQNNLPTKTGNYAMATYLYNDGSSSTDKWFVVPNSTTLLNNLNTNWSAVFRLSDGRVNETTATTVIQSSNNYTVPTFTSAVSFINSIDENGNVVSILYPGPSLL